MSKEVIEVKKQPPPEPSAFTTKVVKTYEPGREPVPIKKIVLQSGVNADFPGRTGAHALEAGTQSGKTYAIAYEPWARRYVITYRRADEKPETVWVPESWCMAQPA